MNISEIFIRRPIMTTLVMLGILIFGVASYPFLPVSDLPNVDFPTIQVTANLPGASPETMASSVATPLEQQFSSIAGISSMNSTSSLGSTQITLQFELSRDIDGAAQDVQSAISKTTRQLPSSMPNPPSYRKVNPADQPILYISLSSSILPLSTVDKYAETQLAQRLSMVDGVAQVNVFGSQKYAVRVQIDPESLSAKGIGIDEVSDAIANFIHPITILSSLPSAGFGALLTLLLFQVNLDIYGFVGIILLIGIVKKNGIMMIDFAIEARQKGKSPYNAIYEACLVRFRPIMMTTMAALMGTLPIALGFGAGADARRPLGLVVVGGLLFSQFLTLYLTPVFYTYVESWQDRLVVKSHG